MIKNKKGKKLLFMEIKKDAQGRSLGYAVPYGTRLSEIPMFEVGRRLFWVKQHEIEAVSKYNIVYLDLVWVAVVTEDLDGSTRQVCPATREGRPLLTMFHRFKVTMEDKAQIRWKVKG